MPGSHTDSNLDAPQSDETLNPSQLRRGSWIPDVNFGTNARSISNVLTGMTNTLDEGSGVRLFVESIGDRFDQLTWLLHFRVPSTEVDYCRDHLIHSSSSVSIKSAWLLLAAVLTTLVLMRIQDENQCCDLWFSRLRIIWSFLVSIVIISILSISTIPRFRRSRHLRLQSESQVLALVFGIGAFLAILEPVIVMATTESGGQTTVDWTLPAFEFLLFTAALSGAAGLLFTSVLIANSFLAVTALVSIVIVATNHANGANQTSEISGGRSGSDLAFLNLVLWAWLLLVTLAAYQAEIWNRCTFLAGVQAALVGQRASRLLEEMLPEQIRMRLEDQNGGQTTRGTTARTTVSRAFLPGKIADEYSSMVLLFSDVCGFTAFSNTVPAETVVEMLTCMFVKFDHLTSAYRIYKLCTIGDAYVALTQPVLSVSTEDVVRFFVHI